MKGIVLVLHLVMSYFSFAQTTIASRELQVTVNRTSNLIFPSKITSIDRGSEKIIVQMSTGNVLRVKADTAFADTTNLTIITEDGRLYSFQVTYATTPAFLNLNLGKGEFIHKDTALMAVATYVLRLKDNLYGFRYYQGKVKLSLAGIYTTSEILICKLRIENNSSLSFEIGRLRFFVKGTAQAKRRPVQEMEIMPLFVQSPGTIIREKKLHILAVVLPKIALGTKQVLQVELSEKGGDRHLSLRLPNKYILNASLLTSFL